MAGDWKPIDAATIAARVNQGITRNQRRNRASNIVLHDGGSHHLGAPRNPTVEATAKLLQTYLPDTKNDTKFVTLESWI
jgi:hypothetical protein